MSNRSHPEMQLTLDALMKQKHARAPQNIVRTHPSFSKLTWRLRNSPGITTSFLPDRHKSRIRLYIVPRKRLGQVNSGESLSCQE